MLIWNNVYKMLRIEPGRVKSSTHESHLFLFRERPGRTEKCLRLQGLELQFSSTITSWPRANVVVIMLGRYSYSSNKYHEVGLAGKQVMPFGVSEPCTVPKRHPQFHLFFCFRMYREVFKKWAETKGKKPIYYKKSTCCMVPILWNSADRERIGQWLPGEPREGGRNEQVEPRGLLGQWNRPRDPNGESRHIHLSKATECVGQRVTLIQTMGLSSSHCVNTQRKDGKSMAREHLGSLSTFHPISL